MGQALANALNGVYLEGDAYHPPDNVAKMRFGQPLDDADRREWLDALAAVIRRHKQLPEWCFVGCSALEAAYRDRLRAGDPDLGYIFLHGERSVLERRLKARRGHFMPPELLASQLETLEEPADALRVSIDQPLTAIVNELVDRLGP